MDESNGDTLRSRCFASLNLCVDNIHKYIDNDTKRAEEINGLKSCIIQYCKMDQEDEVSVLAIKALENESDCTDWNLLQQQYEEKMNLLLDREATFDSHPLVKEFEEQIRSAESNEENPENMELFIQETLSIYIDPITQKPFSNPIRNKICKHVYEKETIERILKEKKTKKSCPYVGCTNKQKMNANHLESVETLQVTEQRDTAGVPGGSRGSN